MKYTLTKWTQSNYEIKLVVEAEDMAKNKEKVLKNFQKDMKVQGFRPGQVPLDMVEKNVQPAYVQLALFEEAVHQGTLQVVKENETIKFIGNIYDLQQEEKEWTFTFTYKLDTYPEWEISDKKWEKESIEKVDDEPTEEDIDNTLKNLQKQYADYQDADVVADGTIFKVKFVLKDADGKDVDTGSAYIGQEEFDEFPSVKSMFMGKKNNEEFQTDYVQEDLPPMFHNRNKDVDTPATVMVSTVSDIKTVSLPEFTPENIQKFFGNQNLTTLEQLKEKITEAIKAQKRETLLMNAVETYLGKIEPSFNGFIPKTLIEEEMKSRLKSLEERFWWEEGLKKYYEKIGEEEKTKMHDEIKSAAKSSLEKFFLLRKAIEVLKIDIADTDWQTPLAVENKLYAHFNA